jgi:hypothetical protein
MHLNGLLKRSLSASAALLIGASMSLAAGAAANSGTQTAKFNVTATIPGSCTFGPNAISGTGVAPSNIALGAYDVQSTADLAQPMSSGGTNGFTYTCTIGTTGIKIVADGGLNSANAVSGFGVRAMSNTAGSTTYYLGYRLEQSATCTATGADVAAAGTIASSAASLSNANQTVPLCAFAAHGQTQPLGIGNYTDTVALTLTFGP